LTKTGNHVWIYTGNKLAKFHGNILSLSENTAKCFRGLQFLTHTVYTTGNEFICVTVVLRTAHHIPNSNA